MSRSVFTLIFFLRSILNKRMLNGLFESGNGENVLTLKFYFNDRLRKRWDNGGDQSIQAPSAKDPTHRNQYLK